MKNISLVIILIFSYSCTSVYKAKVIGIEDSNKSELSYIYIQKKNTSENKVYELPTYKDDSLFIPLKKVSLGDEIKIKLLKKRRARMNKISAGESQLYKDSLGNVYLIIRDYYTPDIEGLNYIKIRK